MVDGWADECTLVTGELYLFHVGCTDGGDYGACLWGIYSHTEADAIYLESASPDMVSYRLHHRLTGSCHNARLSTRDELRDYIYNLCYWEQHRS